ncbi:MAG: sulfurtransferase [Bacteroidota bacterium]
MTALVSVDWLQENINNKDLILLDASLEKTVSGEQSTNNHQTIPKARYFDLKGRFSDKTSTLPNTFPSQEQFEHECQKLGINQNSLIVVFDNRGIYSSPRVWWMFKTMGHEQVVVLDGGLKAWIQKGLSTEKRVSQTYEPGNFKANLQKASVKYFQDIKSNIDNPSFIVVDVRSEGRFNGTENEPRKHLESGHIPGSINLPYKSVLTNNQFKPKAELQEQFETRKLGDQDLVFSCGSGLTACIVLLASEIAFKKSRQVYDGSWTEWAEKNNLTKDLG